MIDAIPNMSIGQNVILGLYAILSFLFSRMFRMASIEVKKIEDKNLLFVDDSIVRGTQLKETVDFRPWAEIFI